MGKCLILVTFILVCTLCDVLGLDLNCPPSSKMTSCSPKCKTDFDCSGRKCCPDICNAKSCVPANLKDDGRGGYKNQNSNSATGSYCGNVKCSSFEKCGMDSNKRPKCVRS